MGDVLSHACLLMVHLDNDDNDYNAEDGDDNAEDGDDNAEDGDDNDYFGVL